MEMDRIHKMDKQLFSLLLADRSTGKNIVWATSDYIGYGICYAPECEIKAEQITGEYADIIKPRVTKEKGKQNRRTRDRAEVFTPSWICNAQNNLVDKKWFGKEHVFNIAGEQNWKTIRKKIAFPTETGRSWQDYVCAKRMEITCGEAPYLVSRYDTVTGNPIADVHERIGLLDRKLRVIDENTDNESDWLSWVKQAYQNIYGYEFQGDNLLLARENLLFTFADYMQYQLHRQPTAEELRQIADIISWNIWQMDGLRGTVPYSGTKQENAVPCVIRDWTNQHDVEYHTLMQKKASDIVTVQKRKVDNMRFDAVVGNPPYQKKGGSGGNNDSPIYQFFAGTIQELSPSCYSLVIPARWFAAGR